MNENISKHPEGVYLGQDFLERLNYYFGLLINSNPQFLFIFSSKPIHLVSLFFRISNFCYTINISLVDHLKKLNSSPFI